MDEFSRATASPASEQQPKTEIPEVTNTPIEGQNIDESGLEVPKPGLQSETVSIPEAIPDKKFIVNGIAITDSRAQALKILGDRITKEGLNSKLVDPSSTETSISDFFSNQQH